MRIVLCEPQALVRAGLKRLIEESTSAKVIGEAGDGQQLLELASRLRPELAISELNLPTMSGMEALQQLRRHYPDVQVLLLGGPAEPQQVRGALQLGASGFLSKDADPAELPLALTAMARRQTYLSPAVSHLAFERRGSQRVEDEVQLTPRQRQVLQLIARGKSTKEIGGLMGVSHKTVETHRMRLMHALGLYGTNALMRYAIRLGLDRGF